MDLIFTIVSIVSLIILAVIYFLSRAQRMKAHEEITAGGKPWTQIPMTSLSMGAALIVLGIVMDVSNRSVNYILIGAGLALSIIEAVRLL